MQLRTVRCEMHELPGFTVSPRCISDVLVILGFAVLVITFVSMLCVAQSDPPLSGDWIVSDGTMVTGRSILLNGNLTITESGHLELVDVDLVMNCSVSSVLVITVRTGGSLELKDRDHDPRTTSDETVVHGPPDGTHYLWFCEPGSDLLISCSLVRECGTPGSSLEGLMIETSDALVENSTFEENYCGLCINGSSPRIENSTFIDNEWVGLYEYRGEPLIQWCTFKHNLHSGAHVVLPEYAWFKNCSFEDHPVAGLNLSGGSIAIHDSRFSNNSVFAIDCNSACKGWIAWTEIEGGQGTGVFVGEGCLIGLDNCDVRSFGGRGIWSQRTHINVHETGIRDCEISVFIEGPNVPSNVGSYLGDCVLERSVIDNVAIVNSYYNNIDNCTIKSSGANGIHVGRSELLHGSVTLNDCRITGSRNAGVLVERFSYCRLEDVEFVDNGEYALYCVDGGSADWVVQRVTEIANESIRIGGDMTVWRDFSLVNTTLVFGYTHDLDLGGMHVIGCTLRLLDGDDDELTTSDATTVSVPEVIYPPERQVLIYVEQHGHLVARNSRLVETLLYAWASELQVEGCEFVGPEAGLSADFIGLGSICRVANSTFTGCRTGALAITADTALDVDGCAFIRCDISVDIRSSRLDMSDCLMDSCGIGINGSGTADISRTDFQGCDEGILLHSGSIGLRYSSLSGCIVSGLHLEGMTAFLSDVVIDGNGTVAMVADLSDIVMEHCGIGGYASALSLGNSTTRILDTSLTGSSSQLVKIIGGQLRLEDSHLAISTGLMLRAQMDARVEVYNTSVQVDSISAVDTSTIDVYWQFRVRVLLATTMVPPPPPVQLVVKDLQYEKVLDTDLDLDGYTPWTWARQLHATFTGPGLLTPHGIDILIGVCEYSVNFELASRREQLVVIPITLEPRFVCDAPVDEGREVTFDGSGSVSHPFDIVTWEWDFEHAGGFSPDASGMAARWTFARDGTFAVALRITDSVGNVGLAVVSVAVNDTAPTARIVGEVQPRVDEDEVIGLEGAFIPSVDPVVTQSWDFGDGSRADGAHAEHSWDREGNYTVTFSVVDADGSVGSASITVEVSNVVPLALASVGLVQVEKGSEVTLDGLGSSDTPSDAGSLGFEWDLGDGENITGAVVRHRYARAGNYTATLRVTDDEEAVGVTSVKIEVFNLPPRLGAIPDVTLKEVGTPFDLVLGALVSDPDDGSANLTLTASSGMPAMVEATARWDPVKGWTVMLVPHVEGPRTVRITVTVKDIDGAGVDRAFNVTIKEGTDGPFSKEKGFIWGVLVLIIIVAATALLAILKRHGRK
jgi:chitodextrinase